MEVALTRILLYQAQGKQEAALETLESAVRAAAPTGLLRVFVDKGQALQPLLARTRTCLRDEDLVTYADRLLESIALRTGTTRDSRGTCGSLEPA